MHHCVCQPTRPLPDSHARLNGATGVGGLHLVADMILQSLPPPCRQTCANGYAQTSGTLDHWCQGGTWSGAPAICRRQCGTYGGPSFLRSCVKFLLNDKFNVFSGVCARAWWMLGNVTPTSALPPCCRPCRELEQVSRLPADVGRHSRHDVSGGMRHCCTVPASSHRHVSLCSSPMHSLVGRGEITPACDRFLVTLACCSTVASCLRCAVELLPFLSSTAGGGWTRQPGRCFPSPTTPAAAPRRATWPSTPLGA